MSETKYILIHEDHLVEHVTMRNLNDLQTAVGGLITSVPVSKDGLIPRNSTVFANDEGLLIGMARNRLAEIMLGYPYLVGPVLIGGECDDNGDTQDVDPDLLTKVVMAHAQLILNELNAKEVTA